MKMSKTDEKAIKLMAGMKGSGLQQNQIDRLLEESGGDIVTAIMKGYNAGFMRGYDRGLNHEVGE